MTSRSYVPLNSTVDDDVMSSRFSDANDVHTQQQSNRLSKRTAIGAAVSFIVVAALVVGAVLPQHDNNNNLSSPYNGGSQSSSSVSSTKSDALNERLNALDYMEKKRQEEYPKKKTSLRSSSMATQGGQLDPLLTKENVVSDIADLAVIVAEEDNGSSEYQATDSSADAIRSSTTPMINNQLDPIFANKNLVVTTRNTADDDHVHEEVVDDNETDETKDENLDEHLDALAYMDKKREEDRPKKTSLRSSSAITKGQLDPLFAKEDLAVAAEYVNKDEEKAEDDSADEVSSENLEEHVETHVDALAYMDKKRQEERPKKTSVRASSAITKDQLDPILAKEELETGSGSGNHVDALAYMDKKREEVRPKKTSVRASSAITKDQLDPILAKEELETGSSSGNHVDALAYMDKKREEDRPKKTSVRASSAITKDQLDPILAKEELETGSSSGNHVDALAYMDKKREEERPKKKSVRASNKVTKDQLDPILAKEEFVTFEQVADEVQANVHPAASTGATTERRQAQELESSVDSSLSNYESSSNEEDDLSDSNDEGASDEHMDEVVKEEFLLSHTWTQADFKVVDFTTEEYEPVDVNRHEGE